METFRSKRAFIMTASSAAVGLGNIFRFPALAARYGFWFIIFYIAALFAVGLPLLYAELYFGRQKTEGYTEGSVAELFCRTNCFCVLCCYLVFFALVLKQILSSGFNLIFLLLATLLAIFCFGSAEKLSKIAETGITFSVAVMLVLAAVGLMKRPDSLSEIIRPSGEPFSADFFEAVFGQVFFSISLSVGVMTAYGSMLKRGTPLFKCALAVCLTDFGVSLLSTAVYLFLGGKEGAVTDSLSSYPLLFSSFFGEKIGYAVTFFFFGGLSFLCLSSVISYVKAIAVFREKENRSAVITTLFAAAVGIFLISDDYERLGFADRSILPVIGLFTGTAEAVFLSFRVRKLKFLLRFFIPLVLLFSLFRKIFI